MAGLAASGFHSSFQTIGNGGFAPKDWQSYFVKYDSETWLNEGDGVIKFTSPDRKQFSLVFIHVPNQGFVIQNDCHDLETNRGVWCKFAVENKSELDRFEEVSEGLNYPVGCVLRPETAWLIVEDFLTSPTRPSARVEMVNDAELSWPEI